MHLTVGFGALPGLTAISRRVIPLGHRFLKDARDRSLYAREILLRAEWVRAAYAECRAGVGSHCPPSYTIRRGLEVVAHAMAILRILDATGARDRPRAEQRVQDLHDEWLGLPTAPARLRDIRNHYEHFEERGLDDWVECGNRDWVDMNAAYGGSIDMLIGNAITHIRWLDEKGGRCRLGMLDEAVDLDDILQWVEEVASIVSTDAK